MNNTQALALFDLDHTLLPIDSDKNWIDWLVEHDLAGDPQAIAQKNQALMDSYHAGTLDIKESAQFMLGFLKMHTPFELAAYHERYMQDKVRPEIREEAINLVDYHLQRGDLCCLVSATNSFIIEPIGRAFGFKHIIGTSPEVINGRYTGNYVGTPSFQKGKVIRVQEWLANLGLPPLESFEESYFYSDSINDVPLLEEVTHPVVTNAQDSLRELAQNRGWRILDLFPLK